MWWTVAGYGCIASATLLIAVVGIWGVVHDLNQIRDAMIVSEMSRLRSHAARTVARIQNEIVRPSGGVNIAEVADTAFLRTHWEVSVIPDESRLYAAVVDAQGTIVAHSNRRLEGGHCGGAWYDAVVSVAGDDVVDTHFAPLTGGARALNVQTPIMQGEQIVGYHNSGLSYAWLVKELADRRSSVILHWTWILAMIAVVVIAAGASLVVITRRADLYANEVKMGRARRFAELGQLAAGMVHEIRNPLNAMRLNLHVLARLAERVPAVRSSEPDAGEASVGRIIQETNHEIERVEGLLRMMLGYARPDRPRVERLDVQYEVQATLAFLKPLLERAEILTKFVFPETPPNILMDRDRFRQVLLNLINNAKESMEDPGQITITLINEDLQVELLVADEGTGVKATDRERIFEPFYTTKELGTGLGLALVRRYIDEADGTVRCEPNRPRGAVFRIRLPYAGVDPFNIIPE